MTRVFTESYSRTDYSAGFFKDTLIKDTLFLKRRKHQQYRFPENIT